jgi:hypothetical protein
LILGDNGKMKLDVHPFSVNTVVFEEKKFLVRIDQAGTTKGKMLLFLMSLEQNDKVQRALKSVYERITSRGS